MTDFNAWDRKAAQLVKQAEKDDEEERKRADQALGLDEGPQGPPTQKASEQRQEMSHHSTKRKNFIAEQQAREVVVTHADVPETVVVSKAEVNGRALRFRECKNVTLELGSDISLVKLFVERCTNVKVKLGCHIVTSFLEMNCAENVEVLAVQPVATVQCDDCVKGFTRIIYQEPENVGTFFHQNAPSLEVSVIGQAPTKIGQESNVQLHTQPGASGEMRTQEVVRGEKEFPMCLARPKSSEAPEPEAESPPRPEALRNKAEAKRQEGNEAFQASDFLQAAVFYTEAINYCEELHLAWANRAQCFLKTGQPAKALEDANKCTELAPNYAKGWFRKGMAHHAMEQYGQAIPALVEAEKLEPKNPQIPEAIRMAQFMCRKHGPDGKA